ncbi:MAG: hypothetical protein R3A10_02305 [Caldilineaceae bacterium]
MKRPCAPTSSAEYVGDYAFDPSIDVTGEVEGFQARLDAITA